MASAKSAKSQIASTASMTTSRATTSMQDQGANQAMGSTQRNESACLAKDRNVGCARATTKSAPER